MDDRRLLSGIVFVNRNGLRWRDAPAEHGPLKILDSRWKRGSGVGAFARMTAGLAVKADAPKTVMLDATHLEAHRTASSLRPRGAASSAGRAPPRPHEGWPHHEAPRLHRHRRTAHLVLPER